VFLDYQTGVPRASEYSLPNYHIEFIEIPRLEIEEVIISASKVRKLLEDKDFSAIEQLVPISTLEYLRKRCGCNR